MEIECQKNKATQEAQILTIRTFYYVFFLYILKVTKPHNKFNRKNNKNKIHVRLVWKKIPYKQTSKHTLKAYIFLFYSRRRIVINTLHADLCI